MKTFHHKINLQTKGEYDFIDLTDQITELVKKSTFENGLVNIQSMHTTGAIVVNESEPLLHKDAEAFLENLAPKANDYHHDNFDVRTVNVCDDECANGHSHCKAIVMPTSACLNLYESNLQLGTWQRIFFFELDRTRPRTVQIHIIGE